jgi:hypothetical protein
MKEWLYLKKDTFLATDDFLMFFIRIELCAEEVKI